MRFETKLAVVVRMDLAIWQRLNMVAFLVSGIAAGVTEVIGEPYIDGSERQYWPMFRQPVLIFGATAEQMRRSYSRAIERDVALSIFTDDLFSTSHDAANRAAVQAWPSNQLPLAGLALYAARNQVDAVVKGLSLHP